MTFPFNPHQQLAADSPRQQVGTRTLWPRLPPSAAEPEALWAVCSVFMHTMAQAGEKERVSHKPHDKWEDNGNSITLHNDVTKKDEELE